MCRGYFSGTHQVCKYIYFILINIIWEWKQVALPPKKMSRHLPPQLQVLLVWFLHLWNCRHLSKQNKKRKRNSCVSLFYLNYVQNRNFYHDGACTEKIQAPLWWAHTYIQFLFLIPVSFSNSMEQPVSQKEELNINTSLSKSFYCIVSSKNERNLYHLELKKDLILQ